LIAERQQLEAEAAQQRQELAHLMRVSTLGELSASIAHEINQPLGAIGVNARAAMMLLARDSPDIEQVRASLQDIVQDNERAVSVVRRLRNLVKKGDRRIEQVDVNGLVGSTLALLNGEFVRRGVDVLVDLSRSAPATLGDPVQLQQVLLNLLINAMDAMATGPAGRRTITLSTGVTPTGTIQVDVRDTGSGIDPADHNRFFEPFYTTKGDGLGLGLTICSTIVAAHGGTLALANGETGGAVATLLLPRRPSSATGQAGM